MWGSQSQRKSNREIKKPKRLVEEEEEEVVEVKPIIRSSPSTSNPNPTTTTKNNNKQKQQKTLLLSDILQRNQNCECSEPLSDYQIPGDISEEIDSYTYDQTINDIFQGAADVRSFCSTCTKK